METSNESMPSENIQSLIQNLKSKGVQSLKEDEILKLREARNNHPELRDSIDSARRSFLHRKEKIAFLKGANIVRYDGATESKISVEWSQKMQAATSFPLAALSFSNLDKTSQTKTQKRVWSLTLTPRTHKELQFTSYITIQERESNDPRDPEELEATLLLNVQEKIRSVRVTFEATDGTTEESFMSRNFVPKKEEASGELTEKKEGKQFAQTFLLDFIPKSISLKFYGTHVPPSSN